MAESITRVGLNLRPGIVARPKDRISILYFKQVVPKLQLDSDREFKVRQPTLRRSRKDLAHRIFLVLQAILLLLVTLPAGLFLGSHTRGLARRVFLATFGSRLGQGAGQPAVAASDKTPAAVIQDLRRFKGETFTRLVLDLTATPVFRAASSGDSLNITFQDTRLAAGFEPNNNDALGLVQQIVTSENGGGVDLQVRFRAGTSFAAFTLDAPSRLVIDVRDNETPTSEFEAELNRMFTPLNNAGAIRRIVIDAGHGGRDTGAMGPNGLAEKDLTLAIARQLKQEIETRLGLEVVLTRSDDYYVALPARSELANSSDADLFISIHANSGETQSNNDGDDGDALNAKDRSGGAHGIETYFLNRATTVADERLAARENAGAGDRNSAVSSSGSSNAAAKLIESHQLAAYLQRSLVRGIKTVNPAIGRDRGVKQAPFYVLSNSHTPSVLVEVAFITNAEDEKLLKTGEFQQRIAQSLTNGIRSYIAGLSQRKPETREITIK